MEKSGTWMQIVLKNVSLVVFLAFLGVLYIANVHIAERRQLKIEEMKKELQKTKWEYMGVEQDLLLNSSPTELEKRMKEVGLEHSAGVPKKLTLEEKEEK